LKRDGEASLIYRGATMKLSSAPEKLGVPDTLLEKAYIPCGERKQSREEGKLSQRLVQKSWSPTTTIP